MTNIPVTGGSGFNVATETISSVDYQKIKIVGGETGSTSVLGVNPDGSLKVSVIGTLTVAVQAASVIQQGTWSVSVVGATISGNPSISGTVNVGNTVTINPPSVYGNVGGSVVSFQGGTWTIGGSVLTLHAPTASLVSGVTSVISSTSQTSVLATAPGAQRNYVTQILVTNGSATGTFVDIYDGGNVLYSGYAAASGGGFSASFNPPLKQANTAQSVDMKSRSQASIIVSMSGYTGA